VTHCLFFYTSFIAMVVRYNDCHISKYIKNSLKIKQMVFVSKEQDISSFILLSDLVECKISIDMTLLD